MSNKKTIITTEYAPSAVGPYSQATTNDEIIFTAGQIAIDPKTGILISGDIEEQTHRIVQNIEQILKEAGVGLDAVMKTTVFMTNLSDFASMNKVYEQYFKDSLPARSTLEVTALPLGAQIEIECIALNK
jgi:2-iminobutanoate/2-iminopropanoate deaminase